MKITAKKIRPCVKIILLLAAGGTMVYVFLFLENYFYPAITGAQTIFTLQKNMAVSPVNLGQFEDIVDKLNKKTASSTNPAAVSDPFQ
jgi:hypothetical protein